MSSIPKNWQSLPRALCKVFNFKNNRRDHKNKYMLFFKNNRDHKNKYLLFFISETFVYIKEQRKKKVQIKICNFSLFIDFQ